MKIRTTSILFFTLVMHLGFAQRELIHALP
ncbi:hypothetical protein GGE08_000540 [Muricauda sp. ARW1Y1]|nr:hypothetical protein [Muricauda sp. ARW1Y1]